MASWIMDWQDSDVITIAPFSVKIAILAVVPEVDIKNICHLAYQVRVLLEAYQVRVNLEQWASWAHQKLLE